MGWALIIFGYYADYPRFLCHPIQRIIKSLLNIVKYYFKTEKLLTTP